MNATQTPNRPTAFALPATFDLRDVLRILSAQRWLIAATTAVVLVATALLTFTATPYYRAKVRVLIERNNANQISFQEIYQLGTGSDDYYSTQHKILESRAVAEAALALLDEADRGTYVRFPGADPVAEFLRLRQVLPVPKSRLVDVTVDHPDPAVANRAADALVEAYVQNGLARLANASNDALKKLERDAEDLQGKLLAAEQAVQEFRQKNEIVTTSDRQSLVAARLEKLTEELAEIERTRSDAASRLRSADTRVADASWAGDLPEVLDNQVIANCKRALLEARAERSQLAQNYKAMHPRMLAVTSKIEAVEAQLQTEVEAVHRGLQRQFERAESRAADVKQRIADQTRALLELEGRNSQYNLLVEEAAATRKLHDTVIARLKEVQLIHGAEQTNVYRIGSPELSQGPVRPNKVLNLLLALIGGLVLAGGLAFTVDLCDRTLKTEEDVTRVLALPMLGLVPRLSGKRPTDGRLDAETLDERSALSEAFRTLRTALAFSGRKKSLRSLAITSAAPSEGKSLVAINLAVAFARSGKRVLLVDADLRRPRLHKAFGLQPSEGFSSVLIGSRQLGEVVHGTPVANLHLLPCGVIPPNPVELLGGPGMQPAIDAMFAAYDFVLFDSPPVGIVSDSCVIGTMVDHVLFVVRSCRTNRAHARRAVAQLHATGADVAGAIVNNSDVRAHRYSDYSVDYSYRPRDGETAAKKPEKPAEVEEESLV
jgi:capsular exopolysaccharide synthesis family protein